MTNIIYSILWFLGGVCAAHFLFEWLYSFHTENEVFLSAPRFGIYVLISIVFAFFKASPGMQEKDKLLNT